MCGIGGSFHYRHPDDVPMAALRLLSQALAHRGPDGEGLWTSSQNQCGLCHRRLAVIDLTDDGAQPMVSNSGRFVITYNGELYNYIELRTQLESVGVTFRSRSDTEVVLAMFEHYGVAMLAQLRGMFAFAIWDDKENVLTLARDRFGIKPLYLMDDGSRLTFASEVQALAMSQATPLHKDPIASTGFHLFGYIPEPRTQYKEIQQVPAGCYVEVDGAGARQNQYYSLRDAYLDREPASETAVTQAIRNSVNAHLVSDVEVGIFLSAGIDSSALLALVREQTDQDPKSITLGFQEFMDSSNDESNLAAMWSDTLQTRHQVENISYEEFEDEIERFLDAMDVPSIDGLNSWFVSKTAATSGLKVALSGLGADELFRGYPVFSSANPVLPSWLSRLIGTPTNTLFSLASRINPGINPKLGNAARYLSNRKGMYLIHRALHLPEQLPPDVDYHCAEALVEEMFPEDWTDLPDQLGITFLELSNYTRNQLLRDTDWTSMRHSLEVRVPYLDNEILDSILALHKNGVAPSKQLIMNAPATGLPASLAERRKTGFSLPMASWLARLKGRPNLAHAHPNQVYRTWARHVAERTGLL